MILIFRLLLVWRHFIMQWEQVGVIRPRPQMKTKYFVFIRPQVAQTKFVSVDITLNNTDNLQVLPIHLIANN